ncbi:hypothetical protein L208DRAFT_1478689 [Tricholoma matsutake]|nr:hypothetical protein L208DRAFT_1478689 [Tricholoma matsutake 945]
MPTRSAIHGYCQVSTSTSHGCPMTFGIEPLITQTLRLVETAHAGTNWSTQINLQPLEAIQWARTLDTSVAVLIVAAKQTCIFRNPHNGQID